MEKKSINLAEEADTSSNEDQKPRNGMYTIETLSDF